MLQTDFLIIGSGIAGLFTAVKIAERYKNQKVIVLTKASSTNESNTKYAQGGVSAVWNFDVDSYEKHIADTLDAGDGLCNKEIVEIVVNEGPERVREIIEWGANFDRNKENKYDLGREGGHSENRILHYKDQTGNEMERALIERINQLDNVQIYTNYYVVDLITQHHLGQMVTRVSPNIQCFGAYVLNTETNKIETILSQFTMLCTGGSGQLYTATTNPIIATGDGVAMVYRAKGRVKNMEFIQFHPTSLYNPGQNPSFLISEAVRGFGAVLKTPEGVEFMHKYDKRLSLAPRDIVARAIDNEIKISGHDFMCLDCRHLDREGFKAHFPTIYEKCKSLGIDVFEQMIPVVPAAHYQCGGIDTNAYGQTSIQNLYACGECSNTGLHGANRLASNSLLEAMVFAHRIFLHIQDNFDSNYTFTAFPNWNAEGTTDPKEMVLITQSRKELKEIMMYYVGIVRNNERMQRALDRLWLLYKETEQMYETTTISPQLCELRNMITVSYLIVRCALMRRESRGLHYTTDFPNELNFVEDTIM